MAFARARIVTRPALFGALLGALLVGASGPVAASHTEVHRVIEIAKEQRGDPWVHYATGPNAFDCVGFVWFAFDRAGLDRRIGGYRGVRSYWEWFKDRGRASRYNGRRGDLVIWGPRSNPAQHIGIYLGDGRAISALTSGVKIHGVNQLTIPFQTYLHVRIERG